MNLNRLNSLGIQGEGDVRYPKKVNNAGFIRNLATNKEDGTENQLAGKKKVTEVDEDSLEFKEIVQKKFGYHYSVQQKIQFLHEDYPAGISSVSSTEFRFMQYGECDAIRVNVLEGYTMSVKQEEDGKYYVEVKYDNGRNAAYIVEADEDAYESKQFVKQIEELLMKTKKPQAESKADGKVERKAPYSYLADKMTGTIVHNGVTLYCNYDKNTLDLGDMSNPDDVITIYLSEGGALRVNRNNIKDLARAIDMFSPEDVRRIMEAISLDAKIQKKEKEIEDEEAKALENL